MLEPIVIQSVPEALNCTDLMSRLHIQSGTADAERLMVLVHEAEDIARPKAVYKPSYVERCEGNTVVIDDVEFTSRVLQANLETVHRVFPYAATCGTELDEWAAGFPDMLENYWLDKVKEMFLGQAITNLHQEVRKHLPAGSLAAMNPGSLPDWPLGQQYPLFTLLGDVPNLVGIRLTESLLMVPSKSVSGILFSSESGYQNCQLCPREDCEGRRSPFDEDLFHERFGDAVG